MKKIFFMMLDIANDVSGLEYSALTRAKLFQQHLGLMPIVATTVYNPNLHKNKKLRQEKNRAPNPMALLNMYDYFQQTTDYDYAGTGLSSDILTEYNSVAVPDKPDVRLYNSKGEFVAYCKRHDDFSISYINYLQEGHVFRRETYDARGFLSKVDLIFRQEDHQLVHECFLRLNGTVAIVKECKVVAGLSTIQFVNLLNEQGRLTNTFKNENKLVHYWLDILVQHNTDAIFVIDRCLEFYEPLKNISAKLKTATKPKLIPVIHSVHTAGDVLTAESNKFYKTVVEDIAAPDAVIVFTQAQKEDIITRFGMGNIHVIPHSYEAIEKTAHFSERDPMKVVYLARYAPEKNHNLAIDAFKQVVASVPKAQLHLYGFGEKKNEIIQQVKDLGLEKNVFVNDFAHDIADIYQSAGLSILTSGVEGFCMSVMESLFYGCPSVAFDIKYGPSDMIQNGVNGYLIPNQNVDLFAKQIIKILKDKALHKQIIETTPQAMKAFTNETVALQWKSLLEQW
jgi:glycosyltransferase involved in cell wall biosynthesis